ncbi:cyclic nucleotide-binding domain-containing protein [Desulfogranum japonicum]|uniref:cyclic nucleotide-binding domain-containing protein n=1 Tax=Desulfogranum japonicum TaxID=231447 RepID=UPI00048C34E7|nr:cyclic nucleotide-binding domain-containing protein [Desulfogranum japonicum]
MNSHGHNKTTAQGQTCQIQEALSFLRKMPLFKDTPVDILRLFAYLSEKEYFSARSSIIIQGQPCQKMYLIVSGTVAICDEYNGRMYNLQQLPSDEINYFGELAQLAQFDCFFSAWAETDTTLLSISREAFQKVMEKYPQAYGKAVEKIIKLHINRFVDQNRKLIEKTELEAMPDGSFLSQDER